MEDKRLNKIKQKILLALYELDDYYMETDNIVLDDRFDLDGILATNVSDTIFELKQQLSESE